MPRSAADNAYEQAESARLQLVDLCDIYFYDWSYDNAGGRSQGALVASALNVPCRLEPDSQRIERADPSGERVVTDWVVFIPLTVTGVNDYYLTRQPYLVLVELTQVNGASAVRHMSLISYGDSSEKHLRSLYVREYV